MTAGTLLQHFLLLQDQTAQLFVPAATLTKIRGIVFFEVGFENQRKFIKKRYEHILLNTSS